MTNLHGSRRERIDNGPWYREPWPWIIIGLIVFAMASSLGLVFMSVDKADDVVSDNYYKQGLAINRTLTEDSNARARDMYATIDLRNAQMHVILGGKLKTWPQVLTAKFIHPYSARLDFNTELKRGADGDYHTTLPHPVAGRWTIEIVQAGGDWRLRDVVQLPEDTAHSEFTLKP